MQKTVTCSRRACCKIPFFDQAVVYAPKSHISSNAGTRRPTAYDYDVSLHHPCSRFRECCHYLTAELLEIQFKKHQNKSN